MGRAPENDVVVPDAAVPEVAARLLDRGEGRFQLTDLTGGQLIVDGAPVRGESIYLFAGSALELGAFVLELSKDEPKTRRGRSTTAISRESRPSSREATLTWPEGQAVLDERAPFHIGSEEDNDLVLDDPFVSAFHCRISHDGTSWRIADLDSTNGTVVNGIRVREAELPDEARIVVGGSELRFGGTQGSGSPEPSEGRDRYDGKDSPDEPGPHGMVAASPAMQSVFRWVERFADSKEPVLVVGASGTGKEGVSRALHDASSRASGPYLALNCGALASGVIESELFGHVRGAFTGAAADKKGAFEAASGGTLFLDEIGELPMDLQPKLLRVLETGTVRRVGGTDELPVDARIVAATHRDLERWVAEGRFREDLFHRLYVLSIAIPPLAERPEDVEALALHFVRTYPARSKRLSADAMEALRAHRWPGNVRELRNVLVRALLTTDHDVITQEDLQFSRDAFSSSRRPEPLPVSPEPMNEDDPHAPERVKIQNALRAAGGNRAAAARRLGISKSTFYDRVRRLGLDLPSKGPRGGHR